MFARIVFAIGGLLGLGAMIPLYQAAGSYTYYGLLGTVGAWQVLFLMIAWQPVQLRLAMIPAVLEKVFWTVTLLVLYGRGALTPVALASAVIPHGLLGVLYAIAFLRTSAEVQQRPER